MNGQGKMQELVERLIRKTRNKEISWSKSVPPGSFMASFPRHSVKIGPANTMAAIVGAFAQAEDFFLILTILNDIGEIVAATPVPGNLAEIVANPESIVDSKRLDELYQTVKMSQSGNTVLDELLQELA